MKKNSRRNFIKKSSVIGSGIFIVPRNVLGGVGYTPPSDQLNLAAIGAGGKGSSSQSLKKKVCVQNTFYHTTPGSE